MAQGGRGVKRDPGEAAKWYTEAAEQGHAHAVFNLGVMHSKGQEVALDSELAAYRLYLAGLLYLQTGRKKDALAALYAINAVSPGNAYSRWLAAEIPSAQK